ncbi:MAG TPA: hypothetical protein VFC91_00985 [Atribacterota bacterium]|nr:hypothetical protein [Atribacterota bacterium]
MLNQFFGGEGISSAGGVDSSGAPPVSIGVSPTSSVGVPPMVVSLPVKDVGEVPLPKVVEGFTPPYSFWGQVSTFAIS